MKRTRTREQKLKNIIKRMEWFEKRFKKELDEYDRRRKNDIIENE